MSAFSRLEGESLDHDQQLNTGVDKREEKIMIGTKILRGILRQTRRQFRASTIIPVIIAALGIGQVFALSPVDPVTGATPWTPPPEAGELRPGLAVTYSYGRQVHVDDIEVLCNPVIGKPL